MGDLRSGPSPAVTGVTLYLGVVVVNSQVLQLPMRIQTHPPYAYFTAYLFFIFLIQLLIGPLEAVVWGTENQFQKSKS